MTKLSQQVADLCSVGYWEPLEVLQVAYASDSPEKNPCPPPGCKERVPPLQPSSSSNDSASSSSDEDDERPDHGEVGFREAESQSSEEESWGNEEEQEDDDDAEDVHDDEEYPEQDNVHIGAFAPDDTEIETLLGHDDLYLEVETRDDEVHIVGVTSKKEVGASKTSPLERRRRSPPSSQKANSKRTSHERSPQSRKRWHLSEVVEEMKKMKVRLKN